MHQCHLAIKLPEPDIYSTKLSLLEKYIDALVNNEIDVSDLEQAKKTYELIDLSINRNFPDKIQFSANDHIKGKIIDRWRNADSARIFLTQFTEKPLHYLNFLLFSLHCMPLGYSLMVAVIGMSAGLHPDWRNNQVSLFAPLPFGHTSKRSPLRG